MRTDTEPEPTTEIDCVCKVCKKPGKARVALSYPKEDPHGLLKLYTHNRCFDAMNLRTQGMARVRSACETLIMIEQQGRHASDEAMDKIRRVIRSGLGLYCRAVEIRYDLPKRSIATTDVMVDELVANFPRWQSVMLTFRKLINEQAKCPTIKQGAGIPEARASDAPARWD